MSEADTDGTEDHHDEEMGGGGGDETDETEKEKDKTTTKTMKKKAKKGASVGLASMIDVADDSPRKQAAAVRSQMNDTPLYLAAE